MMNSLRKKIGPLACMWEPQAAAVGMLRQIHNQPLPFSGHGAHNEIAQMVQKAESFNKMMNFYDSTVEKVCSTWCWCMFGFFCLSSATTDCAL